MEPILAAVLMLALFMGPLIARIHLDRQRERGDALAAELRAAVRRRLGGESMVSVDVRAASPWRAGRVRLSAPGGYAALVEKSWPAVARRLPVGYELVVPAPRVPQRPPAATPRQLPRAA